MTGAGPSACSAPHLGPLVAVLRTLKGPREVGAWGTEASAQSQETEPTGPHTVHTRPPMSPEQDCTFPTHKAVWEDKHSLYSSR